VAEANKFMSSRNTVILAENVPVMAVKEVPAGSASDTLKKLKAKATSADLSAAMQLGQRMLPEGRMVVVSDFASWNGKIQQSQRGLLKLTASLLNLLQ